MLPLEEHSFHLMSQMPRHSSRRWFPTKDRAMNDYHKRGMHSLKQVDMLAAKVDLLAKRLENCEKISAQETIQAMDTYMTCEVCGETGHSGNFCPETHEDLNFVNNDNGFRPQNKGWNQRSNNKEVIITIIVRNARVIKVMVILSLRILSIVKVD